jgi:hypothetical protein
MFRNLDELKKCHSEEVERGENRNYGFGGAAPRFGGRFDAQFLEAAGRANLQPAQQQRPLRLAERIWAIDAPSK